MQALVVDREARSSGVGEALMREAERVDRDGARAFHQRIGCRHNA